MSGSEENVSVADTEVQLDTPKKTIDVSFIVGQSFSVLFKNFLPFSLLGLLVTAPPLLFDLYVLPQLNVTDLGTLNWILAISSILGFAFTYILSGTVAYGTFKTLNKEPVRFGEAIMQGLKCLLPAFGVGAVTTLIMMIAGFLLVIPGLIAAVIMFVAVPATVVEKRGIMESIQRSAELTKGFRWRVFGVFIVSSIVWGLTMFGLAFFVFVFVSPEAYQSTFASGFEFVGNALGGVFFAVTVAVTYHQLRIAKEGLDETQLAAVFDEKSMA